jgi:hypothetical protein
MNIAQDLIPFGALLKRELVVHLRRRSSGSGLIVLVGLAIGGIWLMTMAPFPRGLASMVFSGGLYIGYFVSFLLVPTVAAVSIASERQNQTIDLLQLTLLRASGIVIAKMLNAVGYFLLLCIGVLPVFGVVFFYVGVEIAQFLQGVAIILASTLAHAAIGVAASASQRSPMRAIVRGLALTLFWSSGLFIGLLGIALTTMSITTPSGPGFFSAIFVSLSSCVPWFALASMLTMGMAPPGMGMTFLPVTAVTYQLVIFVLALVYATFAFRRASRRNPPADVAPLSLGRKSGKGATRWISDRANPIFVKEYRTGFLAMRNVRWLPRMRATYIVFGAAFVITAIYIFRSGDMSISVGLLTLALSVPLAVIAPTVAAASLVRERTAPTFELLNTTLITSSEIVVGHVFAAIQGLFGVLFAYIIGIGLACIVVGAHSRDDMTMVMYGLFYCMLQFPILVAIGAWAGVLASTVSRAVILAYAAAAAYACLPGIITVGMILLFSPTLSYTQLPRELREASELMQWILSPPLLVTIDRGFTNPTNAVVWNLLIHALIWIPITFLAARILARSRLNESRLQNLLNRTLLPKEF